MLRHPAFQSPLVGDQRNSERSSVCAPFTAFSPLPHEVASETASPIRTNSCSSAFSPLLYGVASETR
jgi:hypothetical protein